MSTLNPLDPFAAGAAKGRLGRKTSKKVGKIPAVSTPAETFPGGVADDSHQNVRRLSPAASDPFTGGAAEHAPAKSPEERTPTIPSAAAEARGGIKLPAAAQMRVAQELLAGRDVTPVALAVLQNNLRWPGALRVEPHLMEDSPQATTPGDAAVAPLHFGSENFGSLVLEGGAKSPRVAEQLNHSAAWLASLLAVARQHQTLRRQADTDELSGAYNRRYFLEMVPRLLERARQQRFCVTILLFDIDDFKQYNDQFGHAAGDAIIREVIGLLRRCTRSRDLVARIGGDEFAVVFWDEGAVRQPDSQHPRSVLSIAHRFRKAVAEHPWNTEGGPIAGRLSISGGLATFPWDARDLPELMAVADGELLRAKSLGKNAIVLAGPGAAPANSGPNNHA